MQLIIPKSDEYTHIDRAESALIVGFEPELSVVITNTDSSRIDKRDYMYSLGKHAVAFTVDCNNSYNLLLSIIEHLNNDCIANIPVREYASDYLEQSVVELYVLIPDQYLLDIRCNLTDDENIANVFIVKNKSYKIKE